MHLIAATPIAFKGKFNRFWKEEVLKSLHILGFTKYDYGFYVWNSRTIQRRSAANYIARYVSHPAIANGRILKYSINKVTFFYEDANENTIMVRKTIFDFMSSLIQHIPPKQFKMIRHYGMYARNAKKEW